jgi:hypothetical protein
MSFSKNDSSTTTPRVSGASKLFVVNCAIIVALLGLAIGKSGTQAMISDSVHAEFVASNPGAAAPILLAQPALKTRTARTN